VRPSKKFPGVVILTEAARLFLACDFGTPRREVEESLLIFKNSWRKKE
jgi:hypothetical protein